MARKVNSAWNKYLSQTGNSSSNKPPEPNDRHQLILSIIGTETSVGIGVGEAGFGEVCKYSLINASFITC